MPELPEVETLRRGLVAVGLEGQRLESLEVLRRDLRWPVPAGMAEALAGRALGTLGRRGKYLLMGFEGTGSGRPWLLLHLGMSGTLTARPPRADAPEGRDRHVHLRFHFEDACLWFRDPRRFGSVHLQRGDPLAHPLLRAMGPEPLDDNCDPDALWRQARGRRQAIKQFLMDGARLAGVGNIYATEALWSAGIRPSAPAGKISRRRFALLLAAVREVMGRALQSGGASIRDYAGADGQEGWFQLQLRAYGRPGQPCPKCGEALRGTVLGQRATVYCRRCQR